MGAMHFRLYSGVESPFLDGPSFSPNANYGNMCKLLSCSISLARSNCKSSNIMVTSRTWFITTLGRGILKQCYYIIFVVGNVEPQQHG